MDAQAHQAVAGLATMPDQPHAMWAELRRHCPVAEAITTRTDRKIFHVTAWKDVDAVLRDADTFSASLYAENIGRFMGPMMLSLDGQHHLTYRTLVSSAFRASRLVKWESGLIRPTIMRLIDQVVAHGNAELVADVVSKFPARIICGIANLPEDDADQLLAWTHAIHRGSLDPDAGMAASKAMRDYLQPFVEARRLDPHDDLISDILVAEIDGQRLSDDEVYGFLRLLLPAGSESTFRLMGNVLRRLLTMPGLLDRVRQDRSLLAPVIEETLRRDASLSQVSRIATRDTVLGGTEIPAGSALNLFIASANLDESHIDRPDDFDLERPSHRHLSFGTGQHQCLGMHLARLEMQIGINAILDRMTNLRLDPSQPAPMIEGYSFRGPDALHVLFEAS